MMISGRKPKKLGQNPAIKSFLPPRILHEVTRDGTRVIKRPFIDEQMKVTVKFSEICMFERGIIIEFFQKFPFRASLIKSVYIKFL
jgi:hypothetical protein